jgi:hypothetical protein
MSVSEAVNHESLLPGLASCAVASSFSTLSVLGCEATYGGAAAMATATNIKAPKILEHGIALTLAFLFTTLGSANPPGYWT